MLSLPLLLVGAAFLLLLLRVGHLLSPSSVGWCCFVSLFGWCCVWPSLLLRGAAFLLHLWVGLLLGGAALPPSLGGVASGPLFFCVVLPFFSSFGWGCFPSPLLLGGVAWPPSLGGVALFSFCVVLPPFPTFFGRVSLKKKNQKIEKTKLKTKIETKRNKEENKKKKPKKGKIKI